MKRAFTLVELLIYLGLVSIFLGVLTEIFLSALELQSESAATSVVAQDGQYLLARLGQDLSQASSVSAPSLGSASSTLQLQISGSTHTYSLAGENLVLDGEPLNNFQTKVVSAQFSHFGSGSGKDDSVKINLSLESKIVKKSGKETRELETVIIPRNL